MAYPANPPPYSAEPVQVIQLQPVTVRPDIRATTVVVGTQPLDSQPSLTVCAACRYQVLSSTIARPTTQTHLWALCLLVFGCWPCVWVPYCTPSCMRVDHHCPNCNAYLGKYPN
uniref:LITAF domain-containing protein n=1 Tax=Heliothis virescens TaxID=7102 RepID=A0A2A4JV54_HELVI